MTAKQAVQDRALLTLAQGIAQVLTGGWTAEAESDSLDIGIFGRASMVALDGREIMLLDDQHYRVKTGRLEVFGCYPGTRTGYTYPSITVSAKRGPVAIARDIARRFLPDYDKAFAAESTVFQERKDFEFEQQALADTLACILGRQMETNCTAYGCDPYVSLFNAAPDLLGDLRVTSSTSVSFERFSAPPELTIRIVETIKKYNKEIEAIPACERNRE